MARDGDQTQDAGRRRTWWRRPTQPENEGVFVPAGVPPRFNLVRDVVEVLAEDPGRAALSIVDRDGVIDRSTFARIAGLAAQWAQLLALVGIQPRDRVAIAVGAANWHPLFLGAAKLGAVPVLSPADIPVATLVKRAQAVGARLLVADGDTTSAAASTGTQVPVLALEDALARLGTLSRLGPTADTSAGDPAVILFREDSGRPTVVVHAHAAAYAARDAAELWLGAGPGDVVWCSSPPGSPEFLWFSVFAPWAVGAETVVHAAPFDAGERLDLIDRLGVTVLCQPAAEYDTLVEAYGSGRHVSRIRNAVAIGRLSEKTSGRFQAATGVAPLGAFTTVETGLLLMHELGDDPASLGRPLPGLDVCIVDRDGRELPVGAIGEIAVRGRPATLFLEYWRAPEETENAFVGDVYLTGEQAMLAHDGTLQPRGAAPPRLGTAASSGTNVVALPVAETPAVEAIAPVYEITPVGAPVDRREVNAEETAALAAAAAERERAQHEAAEARAAERQHRREERKRARAEAAEQKRRQAEEKAARKAEEETRKRAEAEARAAEKARLDEEQRQAEAAEKERQRAEAEARAAEKARLDEERRQAEAAEKERQRAEAEARAAEQARLEDERQQTKAAEEERQRAEAEAHAAEQARLEDERQQTKAAEEQRQRAEAEAHAAEQARLEDERQQAKAAEEERQRAAAERLAQEQAAAAAAAARAAEEERAEQERRKAAARARAEAEARERAAEEERLAAEARERAEAEARERAEAEARERAEAEARAAAEEAARAEEAAADAERQRREQEEREAERESAPAGEDERSRRGWLRRRSEHGAPGDDLDDEQLDAEAQRITASLIERLSAFSHEGPSRPSETNGHEDREATDSEGEPEEDRDRA